MNKEQFIKGFKYLGIAYNKEFTEEQAIVWYDFFKDTDYDLFRQAIKRIIPQKQFMPSIAEIKHEIALIRNPALQLDANEEWGKVIDAVRRFGNYRVDEAMKNLNPYTASIVRQIGFVKICLSENNNWERKQFLEIFNSKKESDMTAMLLTEPVLTVNELKRMAQIKNNERLLLDEKS